jgi:hypothetical protein
LERWYCWFEHRYERTKHCNNSGCLLFVHVSLVSCYYILLHDSALLIISTTYTKYILRQNTKYTGTNLQELRPIPVMSSSEVMVGNGHRHLGCDVGHVLDFRSSGGTIESFIVSSMLRDYTSSMTKRLFWIPQ